MSESDEVAAPDARTHADEIRRRQRSRALVMALILGGFVLLIFAIAIVKIHAGTGL